MWSRIQFYDTRNASRTYGYGTSNLPVTYPSANGASFDCSSVDEPEIFVRRSSHSAIVLP